MPPALTDGQDNALADVAASQLAVRTRTGEAGCRRDIREKQSYAPITDLDGYQKKHGTPAPSSFSLTVSGEWF